MATDSEIVSQEEVESELRREQSDDPKDEEPKSTDQQPSIYSLTSDEFQNTVHKDNKNPGSMNLDQFLNSIWMEEENKAQKTAATDTTTAPVNICSAPFPPTQPSLVIRQGSLTVPTPWCQKTVDEVWSEIIKTEQQQQQQQQQQQSRQNNLQNPNYPERQTTLEEMTLEEFLIKAGVIREQENLPVPLQPAPQSTYVSYHNNGNPVVGTSYKTNAFLSVGIGIVGETQSYIGSGSTIRGGYQQPQPVSPVPMEISLSQVDKSGIMGRLVVQKVVERRQRRMIKNRESAARARARKQAYTAELETEVNNIKEENKTLKQTMAEQERKIKQQLLQMRCITDGAENGKDKFGMLRRNLSCPY